jgi:hypothetical protein
MAQGEPRAADRTPFRPRSEEELRATLSMLCHFVWHGQTRPGEHMWSIPLDKERDFDCILSDGIGELVATRAALLRLREALETLKEHCESSDRETFRHRYLDDGVVYTPYRAVAALLRDLLTSLPAREDKDEPPRR